MRMVLSPLLAALLLGVGLLPVDTVAAQALPTPLVELVARTKAQIRTLDMAQFKAALDGDGEVGLIIHVREPAEFASGHVPHTGKQPSDTVNKTMLVPHLFGPPDSDAYWAKYDWRLAFESGMKKAELPFSGQFDFVETSYVFPTTHMVAPKEKSVSCNECHTRDGGRLAKIAGVYLPGRDGNKVIEILGWAAVLGSLAGVLLHALGRAVSRRRKEA